MELWTNTIAVRVCLEGIGGRVDRSSGQVLSGGSCCWLRCSSRTMYFVSPDLAIEEVSTF